MIRIIRKVLPFVLLIFSLNIYAHDVTYRNGETITLDLSYMQPNYISVDGDIVTKVTSISSNLATESTTAGGVVIVLRNAQEFTFYIQTQNGLVIPIQSLSTEGQGTFTNIVPTELKKSKKPKKWEKGNSYENELVNIAINMINDPSMFTPQKATSNTSHKFNIEGLKITPKSVYMGNAIYIVKYQIKNTSINAITIDESMFPVTNLKAIFFDNPNLELNKNDLINMYQIIATE